MGRTRRSNCIAQGYYIEVAGKVCCCGCLCVFSDWNSTERNVRFSAECFATEQSTVEASLRNLGLSEIMKNVPIRSALCLTSISTRFSLNPLRLKFRKTTIYIYFSSRVLVSHREVWSRHVSEKTYIVLVYETTTAATATGTSLNKRINEQYNDCTRAI